MGLRYMSRYLVIGLNIGQIYVNYFNSKPGAIVETLDIDESKKPTYTNEYKVAGKFDCIVICTPNYTHDYFVQKFWEYTDCFVVDKPGISTSDKFKYYATQYGKRIFMVKNNLYREELKHLKSIIETGVKRVQIFWNNKNRIPFPGGWFTNKIHAWGGVSRDLLPHLLSYFFALTNEKLDMKNYYACRSWNISDIKDTEYGEINTKNPVYDVDDFWECFVCFENVKYHLQTAWKTNKEDELYINFSWDDGRELKYTFGLCPEKVYWDMMDRYLSCSDEEYKENFEIDYWMHKIMELV